MLQKTNRLTLVEQVAMQMEALIESGQWAVGMRIPAEPELMDELCVSRNTLREAIRALIHAGLLKTRQGDGTYVCSSSVLGAALQRRISRTNVVQTLEVRHALEREAAYLAAQHRTDEDAAAMQACLQACELAAEDNDNQAYVAADIQLHQAIVAASHNDILIELYGHLIEAVQESVSAVHKPGNQAIYLLTHRQVIEAIIAREGEAAAASVHRYIEDSKQESAGGNGSSKEILL
ncbi:FadR/GntR family transcriptional regulator [Paenibacillus mendelii]|uniref:FadR/GntR family transcriptional regulator n=1 Tax=Paenibacillus mendelii TaxID=206163 RepID=A0ABV6JIX4_9BACL|nr:FadR/GntR family transcriptional regulator [Paenibacillus mendelii]MCQ6558799.1 FadR family transcriptional regulator [Paenibacillus mendelii]